MNNNNRFINNNMSNENSTKLDLTDNNNTPKTETETPIESMNVEDAKLKAQVVKKEENQFINKNNIRNETSLNDLNVDGKYNRLDKSPYSDEPAVREKVKEHEKKTVKITVTENMKFFLIVVGIMLVFIFIMPYIFDLIENIRFH